MNKHSKIRRDVRVAFVLMMLFCLIGIFNYISHFLFETKLIFELHDMKYLIGASAATICVFIVCEIIFKLTDF